jgi:hypothetical protein
MAAAGPGVRVEDRELALHGGRSIGRPGVVDA